VVVLSVTEGEDKPLKYPATFYHADLMVLSKIDLLPYVPFDAEQAKRNVRQVQPEIEIIEVSATTGAGLDRWRAWVDSKVARTARH
jgi:hydrogenase nickel incorporation protein HypB